MKQPIDLKALKTTQLAKLINSTKYGSVCRPSKIANLKGLGGYRVGGDNTTSLVAFGVWLFDFYFVRNDPAIFKKRFDRNQEEQEKIREARRTIVIPPIKNPRRRARCEKNPVLFLTTYFPHIFFDPFHAGHLVIIEVIFKHIKQGGTQAVAAPRGTGKSNVTWGMTLWAVANGYCKYVVLLCAAAEFSRESISNLKDFIVGSEVFAEDYPEVCYPAIAIDGVSQRAVSQVYDGKTTGLRWSSDYLIMANIPGRSKGGGAIIRARGIDGAIKGLVRGGKRPDLVILDDIETRESVESEYITAQRRRIIDRDVAGLVGKKKKLTQVMLCTIAKKGCLADEYTDQAQRPSWSGLRLKAMISKPTAADMWERYIGYRKDDQRKQAAGELGNTAHEYYLANGDLMRAGAEVLDVHGYDAKVQADSLEQIYCYIADYGWNSFLCEYQNEPPDETGDESIEVNVDHICHKLNGLERGVVPKWCEYLTCGIDVHGRSLYWSVVAWAKGQRAAVVDYGAEVVHSTIVGRLDSEENRLALESSILAALQTWADWELENGWPMEGQAERRHLDCCFVDSGWKPEVVGRFTAEQAGRIYRPSQGFGSTTRQRYRQPLRNTATSRVGNRWTMARTAAVRGWLWQFDADYHKRLVHTGFLNTDEESGLMMFGNDGFLHRAFAEQICAEVWVNEFIGGPGRGYKEYFYVKNKNNHWLDTMALNYLGSSVLGIGTMDKMEVESEKIDEKEKNNLQINKITQNRRMNNIESSIWEL